MDNLTQAQYQSILHYMQDHGQQNFQSAYQILNQHNFDIQLVRQKQRQRINRNNTQNENQQQRQFDQMQEQEEINKMRKYLLRRVNNRRKINNIKRCGDCIKNICIRITQIFIPEMIKRKVIRSHFYQIYQDQAVIQLKFRNILEALTQAKKYKKNLIVIISDAGRNHCIVQFLKKKKLLEKMKEEYQIVGVIDTDLRNKQLLSQKLSQSQRKTINTTKTPNNSSLATKFEDFHPPCVLILRQRHTQDLQIVEHFYNEKQILSINEETLTKLRQKIKLNKTKQSALIRRITQKLFQQSYNALQIQAHQYGFGHQNGIHHQNFQHAQNQLIAPQRYIANKRQSKLIAQQNKQYLQMQKKKKQKQQQVNKKQQQIQQLLQQRKCRKLSLPEQPSQEQIGTQNIIKIIFRCPNGDNINRKFNKNQKCQILFMWVQLNDQIQFQGDQQEQNRKASQLRNSRKNSNQKVVIKQRRFDLMYSYPPQSLRQKISMDLGQIFEGEDQVKVLIREY